MSEALGMSQDDAEQAWDALRSALVNFDQAVKHVIETKAWEPLGYDTFAQAWADRMRGVRLGTATMAAHVVYALIDSGLSREDALATLGQSGVGEAKFDTLARQRAAGVPPEYASTLVRAHFRDRAVDAHVVHVELTATEYLHFKAVADSRGMDLAGESAKAVRAHFRSIERRSSRAE